MPRIESLIKTQRIMCMKKYIDSYNSTWKIFLDNYLLECGGSFLLRCNYDVKFLPKSLPKFYKECLTEWANYKNADTSTPPNVVNEIIWNNKFICIEGKPLFRRNLMEKGITKVSDLISDTGKFQSWNVLAEKNITQTKYFLRMSVFDSIPHDWKTILRQQLPRELVDNNSSNNEVSSTSSRVLYWDLVRRIETIPTSKRKYEELFLTTDLPWQEIYLLPRKVTVDSKTREFQYKFLHRILFTNKPLHKMGIVNTSMCTFCGRCEESLEHLFIYCEFTSSFWLSATRWLKDYFTDLHSLNTIHITFGFFRNDFLLINHIIIITSSGIAVYFSG